MQRNKTIKVKDKTFTVSISERALKRQIKRIAEKINRDYEGREPVFLAVLNGSFIFAADLLREVDLPCEISFVKLASYQGTSSTGSIREVIGLNIDITDRPVIIVEDIVDTGLTMDDLKADNQKYIAGFESAGEQVALIGTDYKQTIKDLLLEA